MSLVRIGAKHQVVIPRGVLTRLGLEEGDYVEIAVENNQGIIRPKRAIKRDESLGQKAAAAIQEGLEDVAAGRVGNGMKKGEDTRAHLDALKRP